LLQLDKKQNIKLFNKQSKRVQSKAPIKINNLSHLKHNLSLNSHQLKFSQQKNIFSKNKKITVIFIVKTQKQFYITEIFILF